MKLYLIRHAQSEGNVRGALDTALPGPPLTELGEQQAEALAQRLSGEPVVAVYASRATRAQQTAGALAAATDLEVQVVDGVQEVAAGDMEGRTDREAIETYLGVVGPWTRGELTRSMPGGETGEQVRARFFGAVNEIVAKHTESHPEGIVVLVSHGCMMRLAGEWLAANVTAETADRALLPNTGVIELDSGPDGGWNCLRWADVTL